MSVKDKQPSTSCKIIIFVIKFYGIKPRKYGGLDKKIKLCFIIRKSEVTSYLGEVTPSN